MGSDMEDMWHAVKPSYYKRLVGQLKDEIRNAHDAQDALTSALNVIVDAIHAEAGTFWFYDRFGDDMIHPVAVYGGGDITGFELAFGEGVAGQVIESGASTMIQDCQKDPRWAGKVDEKTGFVTKTMICVPLKIQHMTFGSIQIINKKDSLSYDEVDLEFTEMLAEGAGESLASHALLRGYAAYLKRADQDKVTFESIACAPDKASMKKVLYRTNCYQMLNFQEKHKVMKLAEEMYTVFEKAQERNEKKDTKRGFFRHHSA
jgi:signal transduction protein with GAF and PtsI domain